MRWMARGRRNLAPAVAGSLLEVAGTEHRTYRLKAGVLDDAAIVCFTQGQCHALALALRERTGWGLVGVRDWEEDLIHVAVLTPEGRVLDATGVHEQESFAEAWDGELEEVSADLVEWLPGSGTWREPALAPARELAGAVLEYRDGARPSREPGPRAAGDLSEPPLRARVRRSDGVFVEVRSGANDPSALGLYRGTEQSGALASALWLALEGERQLILVEDQEGLPVHAALELADGRILDIDGPQSPKRFSARWPGVVRTLKRPSELDAELAEWPVQDIAAAELLAGPLLEAAGLRTRRP